MNRVIVLLIFVYNFQFQPILAQDTLHGFYNSKDKTVTIPKMYPNRNSDEYDVYKVDPLFYGFGVTEYQGYRYSQEHSNGVIPEATYHHFEGSYMKKGVIDTNGIIVIPIKYDDLYLLGQTKIYYVFTKGDSTGVVDLNGKELFTISRNREELLKFRKKYYGYENATQEKIDRAHVESLITKIKSTSNLNVIKVHKGTKDGLFSVSKNKFIIPLELNMFYTGDEINRWSLHPVDVNDYHALCRDSNKYKLLDLETLDISRSIENVKLLPESKFYFEEGEDKRIAMDIQNIDHIFKNEILEYETFTNRFTKYNSQLNKTEYPKFTVYHFIFKKEGKMGVCNLQEEIVIPAIYDDIYMIDGVFFWVKKNNMWAVVNAKNEPLTPFDFIDIDHVNTDNFESFLYLFNKDTAKLELINDKMSRMLERHDKVVEFIWERSGQLNRKIILNHFDYWAKKSDGCHIIKFEFNDTSLVVQDETWDRIYSFPCDIYIDPTYFIKTGVRKNGKYGYLNHTQIKFDGLVFNSFNNYCSGYVKRRHSYFMESNGWDKYMEWTKYLKYINRFPDKL
jgi:hypothetical protein